MADLNSQLVNQTRHIPEENLLIPPTLGTWQEDYPLREIEFEYILHGKPGISTLSSGIIFAEIGYFLTIVPKLYNHYFDNQPNMVTEGDWYPIIIGIIIIIIMYIFSLLCPNNYKKTVKKIKSHFENAELKKIIRR